MTFFTILPRPRLIAFATAALAVLILAGCGDKASYTAHDIEGVMPDLAFNLTSDQGHDVAAADYPENIRLLYFGYTNCPDICPATMARIHAALGGLDEDQRKKIDVLFISVDPKRDTPERLKRFTGLFGPAFNGLTGTQDQLRTLTKRYRVTYGYGKPNDDGFYLVTHSSAVFAFDKQGRARLLIGQDESVDQLTQDLKTLLAHLDDKKA